MMAFFRSTVPSTEVYFVNPSSIAILAPSFIFRCIKIWLSYVSTIMSSPLLLSSFALDVSAIVDDGFIKFIRFDNFNRVPLKEAMIS